MVFFKKFKRATDNKKIQSALTKEVQQIVKQIKKGKRNEEETRIWCLDIFRSAFGYSRDELETESKILGQRVDIAVKLGEIIQMVVECKAATVPLNSTAVNQAARYAAALGADFALITNGREWMLIHVSVPRGNEPEITNLFYVDLLDDDGVSDIDAEMLYHLTKKALICGDTIKLFHETNAVSMERIFEAISTPKISGLVATELMNKYQQNMGFPVKIDAADIIGSLEVMYDEFNGIEG